MEEIMARGFPLALQFREVRVEEQTGTGVGDLPDECLAAAFRFLHSPEDREAVSLTCQKWRTLEALSRHTLRYVHEYSNPSNEIEYLHDRLMYALRTFPHILRITIIRYTRLPDSFFELFENKCFAQLTGLHLHYCLAITDKSVDYLITGCPALTQLTLTLCVLISDVSLHAIACGIPGLEYLDISYCKMVTDVGIDDVLKSCPNMQDISFSYCYEVDGWGLRNGKNLTKVQAEACRLTDMGLVEGLQGARSIRIFNMADSRGGVRLGPVGLGQLGVTLKLIEVLCFRMCRMLYDSTVKKIAQACPNLRVWDLSLCQEVTFEGWQAVALSCAKLQVLDVHRCRQFCDCSMLAIQNGCPSLCCIHVTGCPLLPVESCERFVMSRPYVLVDMHGVVTDNCCHIT